MSFVGDNIKTARLKLGLNQSELAQKVGLTRAAISRYESGSREPKMDQLEEISKALEISLDDLLSPPSYKNVNLYEHNSTANNHIPEVLVAAAFGMSNELSEILIQEFLKMGIKPEQIKKESPRAAVVGEGFIVDEITPQKARELSEFAMQKLDSIYKQTKKILERKE